MSAKRVFGKTRFKGGVNNGGGSIKLTLKRKILVLDNASWYKKKTVEFYGWESKFLQPYSPDLNPIERIWNTMKARWFTIMLVEMLSSL